MSGGKIRSPIASPKNRLPSQELIDDLCRPSYNTGGNLALVKSLQGLQELGLQNWCHLERHHHRFILNIPQEDLQSFERMLFVMEYAHWFYEDNLVENDPSLKSLTFKEFTSLLFSNCDVLKSYVAHIDDIYKDFTEYKSQVPVTGAIILDETYELCLLVKGWKGNSCWSFPRGKKGKNEEDHTCAIREVLEETGFDVSELLNEDHYIERMFGEQRIRLYIIPGVTTDTFFAPRTKKEISEIAWERLDELQSANNKVISRGITGIKLFMVAPFLSSLKSWISEHPPPVPSASDKPLKGFSVWKAGNTWRRSSLESEPSKAVSNVDDSAESTWGRSSLDNNVDNSDDTRPGRSFRKFRFDMDPILKAMDDAFSSS